MYFDLVSCVYVCILYVCIFIYGRDEVTTGIEKKSRLCLGTGPSASENFSFVPKKNGKAGRREGREEGGKERRSFFDICRRYVLCIMYATLGVEKFSVPEGGGWW